MNLDRTFCHGARCVRANTCDRWTENLKSEAKSLGIDLEDRPISVAQFADESGKCSMYVPLEPPAPRGEGE